MSVSYILSHTGKKGNGSECMDQGVLTFPGIVEISDKIVIGSRFATYTENSYCDFHRVNKYENKTTVHAL